jgi:hypothetical protein
LVPRIHDGIFSPFFFGWREIEMIFIKKMFATGDGSIR